MILHFTCQRAPTHNLPDVVAPGQKEDAGVVLLPVRHDEAEHDAHHQQVDPEHAHPVLPAPEDGVEPHRQEEGGPAIQAVVKQLAQRGTGLRSAGLLPVDPICHKQPQCKVNEIQYNVTQYNAACNTITTQHNYTI